MKILVIDGQGGGMGRSLIEKLRIRLPEAEIIAVGSNALATSAMLRAGATAGATGENAVIYNAPRCDIITGPIGIILANSMYGEISPAMAAAVSASPAQKILIPVNKSGLRVVGVVTSSTEELLTQAVESVYLWSGKGRVC